MLNMTHNHSNQLSRNKDEFLKKNALSVDTSHQLSRNRTSGFQQNIFKNEISQELDKEIVDAVLTNDLQKVETFLKEGNSPNIKDGYGNSLLHNALTRGTNEMIALLVKFKVDPDITNNSGESAIHIVSRTKNIQSAKILVPLSKNLDLISKTGVTPLINAVTCGSAEVVDILLEHKANPKIRDFEGNSPLHFAIAKGQQQIGVNLVKAGSDPNINNNKLENPMLSSVNFGMNTLLEEMLKHGGDANLKHENSKNPVLYFAIGRNNSAAVKLLLSHGADPNVSLHANQTLLNLGLEKNNIEIVDALLQKGADVSKKNDFGDCALHVASRMGKIVFVDKILDKGVNINIQNDKNGKTPLHIAVKGGNFELVKHLITKGSKLEIQDKELGTPIVDVLPHIYNWYFMPKPTESQSEIAMHLLKQGASIKAYETDAFFLGQFIDVLNVKHPDFAQNFLYGRVNEDWEKLDKRRVNALLNQFSNLSKISENEVDKLLLSLLHPNVEFKNDAEAARHSAHLRSWRGMVNRPGKETVEAEGWFMHVYPPLKAKSLILSLNKIAHNEVDCLKNFGESKERVMEKIKSEISAQMSTYYTQRHQDIIFMVSDKAFKEKIIDYEISKYCKEIVKQDVGAEWAMASGFPGHAIYIGFRKVDENTVNRLVYNLGAACNKHVMTPDGLVYPHVVGGVKLDHFINESSEAKTYLKGVLKSKLASPYDDYISPIYENAAILGGKVITNDIPAIPQKRQLAGNCVLKNNNAAGKNRMNNDILFDYLKKEETKFADELSNIDKNIIEKKEKEKDLDSFNYIIKMYNSNKNIDSAINNMIRFLEKRTKPTEVSNKLRDVERIAYYLRNIDEKTIDTFMVQRGAVELLRDMADRRYCDTLRYFLRKYEQNKVLSQIYAQMYHLPMGTYGKRAG